MVAQLEEVPKSNNGMEGVVKVRLKFFNAVFGNKYFISNYEF